MPDITLGNLIALIFDDLAVTLEQTAERAAGLRLQVGDVDLDIPAHLRLPADPDPEEPSRLMVTLPSTRELPAEGRVGRIHITIERNQPAPPEEPL
jgi:hypothetical protein